MAVLIKNPVIEDIPKSSITGTSNIRLDEISEISDINPNDSRVAEGLLDEGNSDEQNDSRLDKIEPGEAYFEHGKLICRGNSFVPEHELNELVDARVSIITAKLEEEHNETIKNGHDKGYEAGKNEATKENEEALRSIKELLSNLGKVRAQYIESLEDEIKDIVYLAICKSFGELSAKKEERISIIENVLLNIKNTNKIKIKLSTDDYAMLLEHNLDVFPDLHDIEVDSRVAAGGCIVETDNGVFDGRLEIQMAKYGEAIKTN